MITGPSIPLKGPVARVAFEEFAVNGLQAQSPTPSWSLVTEYDAHGREVTQLEKGGVTEAKTISTYQDGRLLTRESTFTRDGKPGGPLEWNHWTYDAAGHLVDFRRGRGQTLENHYTNYKYDRQGYLINMEYHQGADDVLLNRTEYKYSDPHTIEIIKYDADAEALRPEIRTLDDEGRVVKAEIRERDWKTHQWKTPLHVTFRYDIKGRLIEQATDQYDPKDNEHALPPGKVTLVYDDKKRTRETSYSDGKDGLSSTVQFDEDGSIIATNTALASGEVNQAVLECNYDTYGNWTECRQWVASEGDRHMNKLWRRAITYR
jgi:hypothetical protein